MKRLDSGNAEQGAVLVVDDEPFIVHMFNKILSRRGHIVLSATNASEALDVLKENIIDVLISDLCMPGTSGVELLATARREYPDVVRIAFSGANDLGLAVKCVNDGEVYRYLTKPCGAAEILEAVDAALGVRDRQSSPEAPRATPSPAPAESRTRRAYTLSDQRIRRLRALLYNTELEALSDFIGPRAGGAELETTDLPGNADAALGVLKRS